MDNSNDEIQSRNDSVSTHSLIDSASPNAPVIAPEPETQKKVAADNSMTIDVRLELCEDIMESEMCDTVLIRSRNIEREVGLRQAYLKFEDGILYSNNRQGLGYEL